VMAIEPDLELPPELAQVRADQIPVERDIDRYLLVIAAIYERTMQGGTSERLVENLRRAARAQEGIHGGTLSVWDARVAIEAATFLAHDELAEADAIIEDAAPSISRLRGSVPVLQLELEHRRVMSAMAKGDFDDALAAIALMEQRTARSEMSRF